MSEKKSKRTLQVAALIRRQLATIIRDGMKDPRIEHITITGIDVSSDLSRAKIYISHWGNSEAVDKTVVLLNKAKGFLRSALAKTNQLYSVPELVFFRDKTHIEGRALADLIEKAVTEDKSKK
ncbi:MAG: 30S ribosome-binding factor RbfA [Gammaproteobacteria bacterium]